MILECEQCQAQVDFTVAGNYQHDFEQIDGPVRFTLLECPRCHSPAVAYQDVQLLSRDDWQWSDPHRIFPSERTISREVPVNIRRSFEEALKCERAGAYLAAVVMCRRTLETLASYYLGEVQNLAKALSDLHADGVIDDTLKKWTDALRKDGNLAAHDPEAVISAADADDIVDFTEAILEYVFVLHERFEEFEKRRTKRTKTN